MHYAIDYPDELTRLVTIGAPAGPIDEVRETRARDFEFIMQNPVDVIARKRMERAFTGSPDPRLKEWVIEMISAMRIDDYRSQANAGTTMNLHERLDGIQVPHEVINGEAETVVMPAVARFIHARSRHSRLHLIPNARHFWSLEEPQTCNALLEKLLDG
jgi:pimeloyl-ACP methyl ester carboxylesterase